MFGGLQLSQSSAVAGIGIGYGMPLIPANVVEVTNFQSQPGTTKKNAAAGSHYTADVLVAWGEGPQWNINGNSPNMGGCNSLHGGSCSFYLRLNGQFLENNPTTHSTPVPTPWFSYVFYNNDPLGGPFGPPYGFGTVPGVDFRAYPLTALTMSQGINLGTTATMPQLEQLNACYLFGSTPLLGSAWYNGQSADQQIQGTFGNYDADPALVVIDLLTNPRYGAGFPASFLFGATGTDPNVGLPGALLSGSNSTVSSTGDPAFQTFCQAYGFGISAFFHQAETIRSILDRMMKNMCCDLCWTGVYLKVIPWLPTPAAQNMSLFSTNQPLAGNSTFWWIPVNPKPKYYTPPAAPLYDLDEDAILQAKDKDSPLLGSRADPAEPPTIVRCSFRDRANQRIANVQEARDENAEDINGGIVRVYEINAGEEFTSQYYAQNAAQLRLKREQSVRQSGETIRLSWRWAHLEPGDFLTVSDVFQSLFRYPVRFTKMKENEDLTWDVEYESYPVGAALPALNLVGTPSPNPLPQTQAVPDSVNPPLFAEPGPELVSSPTLLIALSGGAAGIADPNWGGAQVWMSADGGGSYTQLTTANGGSANQVQGPAKMGVLAAPLQEYYGLNPDPSNFLTVNMSESGTQLGSVSSGNAMAGIPFSVIRDSGGGTEFLSFETATLVQPGVYTLTTLYRGLGASNIGGLHKVGAQFAVCDSGVFSWTIPQALFGIQLFFKFLSFNTFGNQLQSLSMATAYSYIPGATYVEDVAAGNVHSVLAAPSFNSALVAWRSTTGTLTNWSPVDKGPDFPLSSDGVTLNLPTTILFFVQKIAGNQFRSGHKRYFEIHVTSYGSYGPGVLGWGIGDTTDGNFQNDDNFTYPGGNAAEVGFYNDGAGNVFMAYNDVVTMIASGVFGAPGDVLQVLVDFVSGTIETAYNNGTLLGPYDIKSTFPLAYKQGLRPVIGSHATTGGTIKLVTDSSQGFTYSIPAGYVSWDSGASANKIETILEAALAPPGFRLSLVDANQTAGDNPVLIQPASGTIGGQPNCPLSSPGANVSLIADSANNDWIFA